MSTEGNSLKELGRRITRAIKNSGLSDAAVSRAVDVSKTTVSGWKRGKEPGLMNGVRLADVLNLSAHWLAFGSGRIEGFVVDHTAQREKMSGADGPQREAINQVFGEFLASLKDVYAQANMFPSTLEVGALAYSEWRKMLAVCATADEFRLLANVRLIDIREELLKKD